MGPPVVHPSVLETVGGTEITVTYTWPTPGPYAASIEVGGSSYPCNDGLGGSTCQVLGRILRCYTRSLPKGDGTLVLADGVTTLRLPLPVKEPYYPTSTYALRALLPACWATGARNLSTEAIPS